MSGSAGKTKISVDTATLADGDSIAAYLVAGGTQLTATGTSLDVNVTASALPTGAATEATLASLLSEVQGITHAEDSAHSSGHMGVMGLAVRNDAGTALAGTDGDYIPLSTDSSGNLRTTISGTIVANIEGDYAEDDAHVSGDRGIFTLGVRNDNQVTSLTSADGDYSGYAVDAKGTQYVKQVYNTSNLQQIVTVGTTAVALPTTPLTNRTSMFVQMLSIGTLYLGSATVTNTGATRGFALQGIGAYASIDAGPNNAVYGIANAAGKDVLVWEFS